MDDRPIKVLLIEDSIFATRLTQKMLSEAKSVLFDVELKCADRLSVGLEHLTDEEIDIVLLDLTLPDSRGLSTFIRVQNHTPKMPIVVMSGLEDEKLAIESVQKGAQDYLVKGRVDGNLLKRSILYAIERKRAEEELRDAQEQLARKEKLAVLGELAGGMGHELRNPLGAIKNSVYFLNIALENPQQEVKETLEILEKEVAASERLISSLFDFARPKPSSWHKVDVNEVVQEALSRNSVPENVEVAIQLDLSLPTILGDPDQLVQAFENIILNAIQAMPEGGDLVIKSKLESSKLVAVSFKDTGQGISKENFGKLFEPLFTTKARGIGLGLPVVKTLVEKNGGTIDVESKKGKGCTFTVKLPIKGKQE